MIGDGLLPHWRLAQNRNETHPPLIISPSGSPGYRKALRSKRTPVRNDCVLRRKSGAGRGPGLTINCQYREKYPWWARSHLVCCRRAGWLRHLPQTTDRARTLRSLSGSFSTAVEFE